MILNQQFQQTLVLIKPDGTNRNIIGQIINWYEKNSLKIVDMKMLRLSKTMAIKHYEELKDLDFFEPLIEYITSAPCVAIKLEGINAISEVRRINEEIRIKFAIDVVQNTVHGSDSEKSAARELKIFFG